MEDENQVGQGDPLAVRLAKWWQLSKQLAELRAEEMALRKEIFEECFPSPREGVNDYPLEAGYVLKGTYKLDRKLDEAALDSLAKELREEGVPVDSLVVYKPSLVTKEYRELTEEQRILFEQVITIKPASPSMAIVLPKKKAGKK